MCEFVICVCKKVRGGRVRNVQIFWALKNVFFSRQAFPKVVQFDKFSGTILEHNEPVMPALQPSQDAETDAKQHEKTMQWMKTERLPLFLK